MFVGMGILGGEERARNGPSLMPGGPKEAYDELEPILTRRASQVSDGACSNYVGPIGVAQRMRMSKHQTFFMGLKECQSRISRITSPILPKHYMLPKFALMPKVLVLLELHQISLDGI